MLKSTNNNSVAGSNDNNTSIYSIGGHLRIKPVKAFSNTSTKFFSGLMSAIPNPKNITTAIGNEIREITPRIKKRDVTNNQKQGISFSEWLSFRKPPKSVEKSKSSSVSSNDDQEIAIDTINLGDFLKQLDNLDKDDSFEEFTKFEMMESLRMCVQCIYMPLFPQINVNSKTDKLEISNDIDLELLKNSVKIAFSNTVSNTEFDKIWKTVDTQYFPQRSKIMRNTNGSDLVKNVILFRKYMAENDLNPMYHKKIFSKETEYQSWKKDELNQVSVLLNTIDQQRAVPFLGTLNFKFNMVTIDLQKAFKKLSTNQLIYYKICYLKDPKSTQTTTVESEKIDCSKFVMNMKNAIDIEIPETLSHTISTSCEDQDISIEFYYFQLGGLKKIHFGTTKLRISSLMTQAYTANGVWGGAEISQNIDLHPHPRDSKNENEVIGCISLCMKATFRRYPCKVDVMTDFSKESRIDWIKLYKFTLKSLVKNREKLQDSDCEDFLCPSQAWILNDFEKRYGITETYKRLLYLEVFASNIKLAITFSDDLQKCLELLDNNLQSKYFPMTQTERNRYFDLTETLLKKIEKAMKQYITMFPKNEPRGALKSFVFVHKLLCCKYNNRITEKEYSKRLKKIINGAFQTHLDAIIEDIQNSLGFKDMNGPILVELCTELVKVIDEVFYFSGIFSIDNFEMEALTFYYSNLDNYIQYAKKNDTINGFYMLTLCNKLKPLHDEIRHDFSSKELSNFKFIDSKSISEGYSERYMTELSEMLSKWIKQSIAIDTFEPINDACMHSTSVVDYFTSVNQIFELLQKLEFTDSNLYVRFAELVIRITTTEYAKKVSDQCLEDINNLSNQNIDSKQKQGNLLFNMIVPKSVFKDLKDAHISPIAITKHFVIRLNDIEACRQELQSVVKNIFDTSSWAEYEEIVEESGFEDYDRDDIDFDEIEKKSNQKSKLIENEYSKKSNMTIQKFSKQFNEVLFDLTLATANIFQAPIRNAINYVLQSAKKDLTKLKNSTRIEVKNLFQSKSDALLESSLFVPILTPALEILSQNCYKDLFKKVLERLFLIVVEELSTLLLDPANFTRKPQDRVFLTAQQAYILESILELFIIYFCGSDEKTGEEEEETGLPLDFAKSKSKLLVKLCKLYNTQTEKLEAHLQKLASNAKFAEKYPVKSYHIVSILFTRKKNDEKARKIYSKFKETAKIQRLIVKFNIYARYSIVEGTDKLTVYFTSTCYDSTKIAPGTIHVGGEFLLFEFRFSNVYHRISLRDIETINLSEGFMRKGISIHFKPSSNTSIYVGSSSNNPKNRVKFYFSDESVRTSLIECLQNQFKTLGNNVEISKTKPVTSSSNTNSNKLLNLFKFGSKPSTEQTKGFISSASDSTDSSSGNNSTDEENREDIIKKKFDIPLDEKCITFFSSNVKKDSNAFKSSIFVFTSSFCFYAVQATFYEKFTWNRIDKITQNLNNLKISVKDYGEIEVCDVEKENCETFLYQYKHAKASLKNQEPKNDNISNTMLTQEEAQSYFFQRFQIDKICSKEKLITYFLLSMNSQEPTGIAFVGEQYFCFEWMKPQKKDTVIPFISIKSVKKIQNQDESPLLGTISILTNHGLTFELPIVQSKLEFDSLYNLLRSKTRRNQTESLNPFSMVSSVIGNVGSSLFNTAKSII